MDHYKTLSKVAEKRLVISRFEAHSGASKKTVLLRPGLRRR